MATVQRSPKTRSTSQKKTKHPGYSTGVAAQRIYTELHRDFRNDVSSSFEAVPRLLLSDAGIKSFRARPERDLGFVSVARYKKTRQLEALLKKFRFSTDAYTDDELSDMSVNSFIEDQVRLHNPMPLKLSGIRVLQRARVIAKRILGDYPGDEVVNNVRFGRKSSIGCPLSLAFIDIKLSLKAAFTGTKETVKHFLTQVLPGDHILSRILKEHDLCASQEKLNYSYLNLVEVPKTWKAYRLITPLTLIGLFFSYGVGRVVTQRLKDAGLDISKLQDTHRQLVKQFSVTRKTATADLTKASDSITSVLLNYVLPRPWYVAVKKTFVRNIRVPGREFSSASVLPMGNGATFPLETLVFYCIIKAIGELTGIEGVYSVYGDDLLYPSRLHPYVTAIFPQFHLVLNTEKTFVTYPFRESCGSDFYRGSDVRPYFIKGEAEFLTRVRYEAFLYKVYNGLTARWETVEIRSALTWILSELAMISGAIYRVPPHFPDYSGIRVSSPLAVPLSYNLLPWSNISIRFYSGSRWFQFDFLTETPKKRVVKTTEPYYWLALQGLNDEPVEHFGDYNALYEGNVFSSSRAAEYILEHSNIVQPVPKAALSWKKTRKHRVFYQQGRKIVKDSITFLPVVPSRKGSIVSTGTTKTESISDWF